MENQFEKQVVIEAFDIALKKGCYGLTESINIVNSLTKLGILHSNNIQNDNSTNTVEPAN
jgi:hypothetical protein